MAAEPGRPRPPSAPAAPGTSAGPLSPTLAAAGGRGADRTPLTALQRLQARLAAQAAAGGPAPSPRLPVSRPPDPAGPRPGAAGGPAMLARPGPTGGPRPAPGAGLPPAVRAPASSATGLRLPAPPPTLSDIERTVDDAGYEAFSDAVRRLLGFDLLQYKRPQVWRRANSFARQHGYADLQDLVEACKSDLDLRAELRDMITINVSEFFRNPEAWEQVRGLALPELLGLGRPIRFWSAGCSLGYEPFTWAMLVREAGGRAETRILATDLDETILVQARAASYAEPQMVGVSAARRARFFAQVGDRWVVKPELRDLVQWRRQDLLRDPFPSDLDLIACRNVVIYFTDAAKDGLYRRFAAALRPGGFLFIGATEAISDWRAFGLRMLTSGLYRKEA